MGSQFKKMLKNTTIKNQTFEKLTFFSNQSVLEGSHHAFVTE